MSKDNYFIKTGYRCNEEAMTLDEVSGGEYWDAKRTAAAKVYQQPVYAFLARFIREHQCKRLLDIGCGVGEKLSEVHRACPDLKITGVDQQGAIDYCQKTHDFGNWYVDDFENPSLDSEKLGSPDIIVSSDVIEHLINPDLLLDYVLRCSSKDTYIVLSTPERDRFRGKDCTTSPNKHHIREWNYKELTDYLESRGFRIIEHIYQYPIRFSLNRFFYSEIIARALQGKALKYNQVLVLQVR